jgi:polyhydroxybutyrate depolymerase
LRSEARRRAIAWIALAAALVSCSGESVVTTSEPSPAATTEATTLAPSSVSESVPTTSMLPATPSGSIESVRLEAAGFERIYRLYVPPQHDAAEPAALVVDLHGFGSNPEDQDRSSEMRRLADVAGFVVAQPAARGAIPTWNPQPGEDGAAADVRFIRALVADVGERVAIDAGKVFAAGFSNGGGMVHRLACDAADVFAAVGTVAGQYPLVEECDPVQPIALMSFHGTNDLVVPIAGVSRVFPDVNAWVDRWARRNGCAPVPARRSIGDDVLVDTWAACDAGVEVVFHTIEDGGHAWPGTSGGSFFATTSEVSASQEMWAFFMKHARS